MTIRNDVLILGAGVIGLSCAYYLARAGRDVTLLDQGRPGCGSSHGNCGTITPSHAPPLAKPGAVRMALESMLRADAPFYVKPRWDPELWAWLWSFARRCNWSDFQHGLVGKARLLLDSRELLAKLVRDEALDCEFAHTGHLTVFRDPAALAAFDWWRRALDSVGIEVHALDGPALRAREPALRDEVIGGFDTPLDAQLRPDRYVAELARVLQRMGVNIVADTEVTGFELEGADLRAVHTARGDYSGTQTVLALGAWTPQLTRQLGLKLPIQPGKGYSITTDRPITAPKVAVVCRERSVAITPWRDSYRIGSTMEFSGYDASINRRRIEALVRSAGEYLRDPIGAVRSEEWWGWRPMSSDDLPIIGAAGSVRDLWLATGHGMLGMSMSAATGLLIADMLCGRAPSLDPAPYSPERFR